VSISAKKSAGILVEIALNLWMNLWCIAIFTISGILSHEYGRASFLVRASVSFNNFCNFQNTSFTVLLVSICMQLFYALEGAVDIGHNKSAG